MFFAQGLCFFLLLPPPQLELQLSISFPAVEYIVLYWFLPKDTDSGGAGGARSVSVWQEVCIL